MALTRTAVALLIAGALGTTWLFWTDREANGWWNTARERRADGDLEGAERALRVSLGWRSTLPGAHRDLAETLNRQWLIRRNPTVLESALASAETAVRLDPVEPQNHYTLGLVHLDRNNPQDALRAFQEAVRLDPYNRGYLYVLGEVFEQLGQREAAIDAYTRSLTVMADAKTEEALRRLGSPP